MITPITTPFVTNGDRSTPVWFFVASAGVVVGATFVLLLVEPVALGSRMLIVVALVAALAIIFLAGYTSMRETKEESEWWKTRVETCVAILATGIATPAAAIWTYYSFFYGQTDALDVHQTVSAVKFSGAEGNKILLGIDLNPKNIGKAALNARLVVVVVHDLEKMDLQAGPEAKRLFMHGDKNTPIGWYAFGKKLENSPRPDVLPFETRLQPGQSDSGW